MGCEGYISGKVIDTQSRAINGATVSLYIHTYKALETKTDNAGMYRFENIVWGIYTVKVEKADYQDSEMIITLGESYACSMEAPDIGMYYDDEQANIELYDDFITAIRGDNQKLADVLQDEFTLTFTGSDEVACTKDSFCQDCPVPEYVDFTYSNIVVDGNNATVEVEFYITGLSSGTWSSVLSMENNTNDVISSWKISGWEIGLIDFNPSEQADKGWADPAGYVEFDSDIEAYRWICSW